jgi:hypothetical protein
MATAADVLSMLIPQGGWTSSGNAYEDIEFLDCEPITKTQFEAGVASYNEIIAQQETKAKTDKAALLSKLGITEDEAKLLLG